MLNIANDDGNANARFEEVIKTLKSEDVESLKALFSKDALEESEDFDESAEDLFSFIDGTIISWKKSGGPTVSESNNYGNKTKEVSSFYYVTTDTEKYYFLLIDYPRYDDNPEQVGLSLLLAVKADDRLKVYDKDQKIIYDGDQELSHKGIYLPIKE